MVTTILKREADQNLTCCIGGGSYIIYASYLKYATIDCYDYDVVVSFCPFCGAKIEYID